MAPPLALAPIAQLAPAVTLSDDLSSVNHFFRKTGENYGNGGLGSGGRLFPSSAQGAESGAGQSLYDRDLPLADHTRAARKRRLSRPAASPEMSPSPARKIPVGSGMVEKFAKRPLWL